MLIITINQTSDVESDLERLGSILTSLDCFPGKDEVLIKVKGETYEIRLFKMPHKVEEDNIDMISLLVDIDNVEIDTE